MIGREESAVLDGDRLAPDAKETEGFATTNDPCTHLRAIYTCVVN